MIVSLILSFQLGLINFIFTTCLILIVFLSFLFILNEFIISFLINLHSILNEKRNYHELQA